MDVLPTKLSKFRLLFDHARITDRVESHQYEGSGTEKDPYVVTWVTDDPGNPYIWSKRYRWLMVSIASLEVLSVAFASSAWSGMS